MITTVEFADVYADAFGRTTPALLRPTPSPGRVAHGSYAYIITGDVFEYRRYDLDGSLDQVVRVFEPAIEISDAFFDAYKEGRIQAAPPSVRPGLRAAYEEMPVPKQLPMLDQIFVDQHKNVWVRRYRVNTAENQIFHVFDEAGAAIGTMVLPPQFGFRSTAKGLIVGVWRDAMGEQSVRVYLIERTR